jgi:hypothetical protein
VFGDPGLYAMAQRAHAHCDLTLLTALDLPWQADGLQRDGPQVREPVDAKVRAALQHGGCDYSVIHGSGADRTAAALAVVQRARSARPPGDAVDGPRWQWHCERCGEPDCERHERRRLLPRG